MYCEAGTPIFMLPSFDALSREYDAQGVPPPPPPPPLSSSKTTREVLRDEGIAPSDGYFTYLAAALDLPLTLLAHRRAHPYGNFSVPPYMAARLAQSVERELIKVGRWRAPPPLPGQQMNSKTEGTGAAATRPNAPPQADTPSAKPRSSASHWLPSFLLPFTTTQPPPPLAPLPPPRALPPPKPPARPPPAPAPPLPATVPAASALTTPSATAQHPGLVKSGINEAGQAGLAAGSRAFAGLSALETPFGRGFRLVLPDTLGESLGSTALGGEALGGASHGEGRGEGDGDGSTGVGASGAVARGNRQPSTTAAAAGSGRSGGGSSSTSSSDAGGYAGGSMTSTPPEAAITAAIPAARNILSMPPPPRPPRIATPNIAARPPPPPLEEAEDDLHDVAEAEPRKDEPPVQRHLGTFNTLEAAADAVAKAYKKAGGKPHSHQYPAGLQAEARQSEKPKKLKAGGAANGDAPEPRQTVTLTIGEADLKMLAEKNKMVDASVAANSDAPEPLLPPSPLPPPPPLHIHIDHSAAIPAKDAHESCREGSRGCDASKPVSMSAESTSEEAAAFTLFVRNSAMFSTAFTLREARVLAGAVAQESGAKPGIKPGMSGQSVRDAVHKIQEERVDAGYPLSEDDSLYSRMLHSKASAAAAAAAAVAAWEASQEDSASYEASLATPSPKGVAMAGKEVSRSANFARAVELASQMHEVLMKLDVDERTAFRSTDQWLHVLGDLVSQEHSLRKFIQA